MHPACLSGWCEDLLSNDGCKVSAWYPKPAGPRTLPPGEAARPALRLTLLHLSLPLFAPAPTTSRPGGRAGEAKEAEGASQVEAGKRLEELRRRRGETESEEFEKLKQKQQEAALELEELKKKREERRKVLEEEEQKRKQEEAERKVREEVSGVQPAGRVSTPASSRP